MKKTYTITTLALISITLFSCADKQKQEKDLLKDVINIHDRVMSKDELIMINKMQLDTLMQQTKDSTINKQAKQLSATLDSADSHMENWMHNFDAENKGKSHEQIMDYLNDQKREITAIDSELNASVAASSKFIKQIKSK
ncbi:hypothetical protein [Mucilaginibacter segetis]|uniref:Viral A-type inclusion protein n=1 Tax=Mucilaginibacter segetis TaxID=2793071 RepID=A0A934UP84_9SPHI|nr:hypothetical protein [Mucilaginibacter segetis]MBK0381159.1 hypothetical protein [Mucilaginibacter segetis]